MKQGLKQNLFSELQQKKVLTYEEAEQIAKDAGYKADNMTRRMREMMEKGLVEPVLTEKKHIRAYRYIGTESPSVEIYQNRQLAIKI